jgi:hypothetical protein
MAWSFSHSQEAYDNLRANLQTLPLAELRELFAQWVGFEAGIAIAMISDPEFEQHNVWSNPSNYDCEDLYNWIVDDYNDTYKDKSRLIDHGMQQFTYATIAGFKVSDSEDQSNDSTVDLTSVESLASAIWYRVMGEYGRTSDNGGFNAYIDPYHYTELSFDLVDGAELEY